MIEKTAMNKIYICLNCKETQERPNNIYWCKNCYSTYLDILMMPNFLVIESGYVVLGLTKSHPLYHLFVVVCTKSQQRRKREIKYVAFEYPTDIIHYFYSDNVNLSEALLREGITVNSRKYERKFYFELRQSVVDEIKTIERFENGKFYFEVANDN